MKAHGIILPLLLLLGFAGGALASPHGGQGGTPFNAPCGQNSVLVGLVGAAGTLVERIQPVCVRVKSDGSWDGVTFGVGFYGGRGGRYYEKVCDNGFAVGGINGKAGTMLDQLELGCGRLGVAADGKVKIVTGLTYAQPPIGGPGGATFNDPCPTGEIVLGLMGRHGNVIDQIDRSCGTITPPAAAPFTASLQASPSSTVSSMLECNTQVTFTVGTSGGPTTGNTEYRVISNRLYSNGNDAGEERELTTNWTSSSSVAWTPSAGVYKIRAKARRGVNNESTTAETRVYVRLGVSTTANPASPRPSPGTVALSTTVSCTPPNNATLFYSYEADTTSSGVPQPNASSWTTPSLAAGGHTLKANVLAVGSPTFDGNKQLAMGTKEMSYQVGGGEVFTSYFAAKHKHEKCVTCHTMTDAPSDSGSSGAARRKWHIDTSRFTASTDVTQPANCNSSNCHTTARGYPTDWRAAVAAQRWTETTADATICSTINNASISNTNSAMHNHLTTDARILWAIGRMGVSTTEWSSHSTAWTTNNRACQ